MDKNQLYRRIPKVDVLLEEDGIRKLEERYGRSCVKRVVQDELERVRILIGESVDETDVLKAVEQLPDRISKSLELLYTPNIRSVINGTGTILHTNLGRAPLNREHAEKLAVIATQYSTILSMISIPIWSMICSEENGERGMHILNPCFAV